MTVLAFAMALIRSFTLQADGIAFLGAWACMFMGLIGAFVFAALGYAVGGRPAASITVLGFCLVWLAPIWLSPLYDGQQWPVLAPFTFFRRRDMHRPDLDRLE